MSETKQLQYGDYIDTIELKYKLNKEFIAQIGGNALNPPTDYKRNWRK